MERRIALIPRAQYAIPGRSTTGEYALYLTNQRTLLIEERAPDKLPLWGGPHHMLAMAAEADSALKPVRAVDYGVATVSDFLQMPGTLEIWHSSIDRMETHRVGWALSVQFYGEGRRLRPLHFLHVVPPLGLMAAAKAAGQKKGEARRKYWHDAEEAFRRALPPEVGARSRWAN